MSVIGVNNTEVTERRQRFLEFLFDRLEGGYICIARRKPEGRFEEKFFQWPKDKTLAMQFIADGLIGYNIWFCPMVLSRPNRSKYDVTACPSIWADLDECSPTSLLIPPTLLVETSPGRHQGLWVLKDLAEPVAAEEISKAIAYKHADEGCDKSGWDLTQLLRVPFTYNYKYNPPASIRLLKASGVVSIEEMREAYAPQDNDPDDIWPYPENVPDGQRLLKEYRDLLDSKVWVLMQVQPDSDWSKSLWQLEMRLAESGLSREEMFSIAKLAACNKYVRDGRDDKLLWKDVCRAWTKHRERSVIIDDAKQFKTPDLLTDGELADADADITFIDDYVRWAKGVGDAAEAYHHAGAFTILSALMAGSVQLPTSFGTMVPNLWFLLLADTTLTRKSTALDLAVDQITDVDPDLIMATDGSIEGMFSALSVRPGQPSIFLRDEFSGLLEMMIKRDYYAGMGETLTKMYDGKYQKRVLRREVIEVRDPVLIVFAGGIRTKIQGLLTSEHITSGFLPRFIFVAGQSDIAKLRPLGPPVERVTTGRDALIKQLKMYHKFYSRETTVKVKGVELSTKNLQKAELTPAAWQLYNKMEMTLLETGVKDTAQEHMTPVMDRLAKSGLKAAVLIAASRMPEKVVVEERDIIKAFSYVVLWRAYAMDVISSVGLPSQERQINLVHDAILRQPGIMRSTLMSKYHLTKRDADALFDTLEQRGKIERVKRGKSESLSPVGED